jgi:hypothetical protein
VFDAASPHPANADRKSAPVAKGNSSVNIRSRAETTYANIVQVTGFDKFLRPAVEIIQSRLARFSQLDITSQIAITFPARSDQFNPS